MGLSASCSGDICHCDERKLPAAHVTVSLETTLDGTEVDSEGYTHCNSKHSSEPGYVSLPNGETTADETDPVEDGLGGPGEVRLTASTSWLGEILDARAVAEEIVPRMEFQGGLIEEWDKSETQTCQQIVLITDPGQDNDDEMAFLLLSELRRKSEVKLVAVVANLRPANRRAALARGTLDMLDMTDVPVGIGSDGGSAVHTDKFSEYISEGMTGVDYFSEAWESVMQFESVVGTEAESATSEQLRIYDGEKLLAKVLAEAQDRTLNLVLISSLKDAAMLLRSDEELFLAKIKAVTIMGGMEIREPEPLSPSSTRPGWDTPPPQDEDTFQGFLEPTEAHNNIFDTPASEFFYHRCQEIGMPLVVLSRFSAYGCPVQKYVYDLMVRCPVPHPTVCRLQRAQRDSIESLWQNVCMGGKLPPRCNKPWFCDTFCGGEGKERDVNDSMWDLIKTFNMYDPLAVLAALPNKRDIFFDPKKYTGIDGTVHLNIGESKDETGIMTDKIDALHDYLLTTWIRAAGRPRTGSVYTGEEMRPKELDQEQLTAALGAMKTHTQEELSLLNMNVLRLLDEEWPQLKNSSLLNTWRDRDELMRSIGPEMTLVDPDTIKALGRIPHSAEGKTISMETAAEKAKCDNKRFFIEMFSHRWHSPFAPDDRYFTKARILCEWAKYRESMNFKTFFWIDYACINQGDIAPGVTMLPLYVSCCNNILCFDTPSYEPRAWCRVERLMFTAFVAPNNEFVGPSFEYKDGAEKLANGELKPSYEGVCLIPDPASADAQLSWPSDSKLINKLKNLCSEHWSKCWKDGLMDIVETKVGLKEVRNLRYGGTQARVRKFA